MHDRRAASALILVLTVFGVFLAGHYTTALGPYSDNLHLLILSSVFFFTFLIYMGTVGGWGRRRVGAVKLEKGLSTPWKVVLAFFLGGAVSSIAQDPSDYLFFWISSKGALDVNNQLLFWYYVPFLLYIGFFFLGLLMAKAGIAGPESILYLFMAVIAVSAFLSVKLPQFSSLAFEGSLLLATIISLGIVIGVRREVYHK